MQAFTLLGREGYAALDSATNTPHQTVGGKAAYPTILAKAAVLWCGIIKNHPFLDGNKRVGTTALLTFLLINGYAPLITPEELVEKALEIANTHGLPWRDADLWLKPHCLPLYANPATQRRMLRKN